MDSFDSRGDQYVTEALKHERALRKFFLRWTRNQADAEELLYETYLKLYEEGRNGKEIQNVRSYSLETGRRMVIDRARRAQVVRIELVQDMTALDVSDELASVERRVSAQQQLETVRLAVLELSPRCQQVFTLHRLFDRTHAEIARQLGISIHAVRYEIKRACEKLRGLDSNIFTE